MRIASIACAAALCTACATPRSSAWTPGPPTPPSGRPVRVLFVGDPAGAEEIGVVEASGCRPLFSLADVVTELGARAASIGADAVKVDRFATRYEMVTEQYTYDCSTTETRMETRAVTTTGIDGHVETSFQTVPVTERVEKTCTGWHDVEVATFALTGRAFRTKGAQP